MTKSGEVDNLGGDYGYNIRKRCGDIGGLTCNTNNLKTVVSSARTYYSQEVSCHIWNYRRLSE